MSHPELPVMSTLSRSREHSIKVTSAVKKLFEEMDALKVPTWSLVVGFGRSCFSLVKPMVVLVNMMHVNQRGAWVVFV